MKVWVDEIAKWVVAEPPPPVEYRMEYRMDEGALLARPLAPENPGRWVARGALWVKREPLPALEYMDEAEATALLEGAIAPRNPGRWIDRARNRDAGKPL